MSIEESADSTGKIIDSAVSSAAYLFRHVHSEMSLLRLNVKQFCVTQRH